MTVPRQKPPRGAQINPAHSLARDLWMAYIFNEASGNKVFDYALGGHYADLSSESFSWSKGGIYSDAWGNTALINYGTRLITGTGPFSVVVGFMIPSGFSGSYSNLLYDQPQLGVHIDINKIFWYDNTDSFLWGPTGIVDGNFHQAAFVRRGTGTNEAEIWLDGDLRTTGTRTADYPARNRYIVRGFKGANQYLYIFSRALTPAEIKLLDKNPYAMFDRPSAARHFYVAAAGAVTLDINDASHSHSAESPVLTQINNLTIQAADHTHEVDSPTLTQLHNLTVRESGHTQGAESPVLTQLHNLTIQEAGHAQSADNVTLVETVILTVSGGSHGHTADGLSLTQVHNLLAADSLHAHLADTIVLPSEPILDTSIESLTVSRSSKSLTVLRSADSLTVKRTIEPK